MFIILMFSFTFQVQTRIDTMFSVIPPIHLTRPVLPPEPVPAHGMRYFTNSDKIPTNVGKDYEN
jgi:hypothetical protein